MRINCIVTHQTLAISDPEAAEKSVNYLECAFYFLTPDWQGLTKTAFFIGTDGKNYSAVIQDGTCVVPWEAITEPGFLRMSVAGFGQMSLIITTDIASLRLRDTIFGGDPSQAPSPDQYTQIMQAMTGKVDKDQGAQNAGKILGINDSGKVEAMEGGSGSSDLLWRPSVSESGDLSWTQDSSTDPPETVNIMGPQGPAGKDGNPGQKGETGAIGPAGKDGITPTIGENGNWYLGKTDTGKPSRGEQGQRGERGPQGEQGETGEQGPPGKDGTPGQQGEPGPAGQTGPTGPTGATPNIQIGTVQTLEPGQDATASMTGTPENPLLNLGIPKGEKGDLGGGGGTVDPEQIKQAVNGYLEENPPSGMTAEEKEQLDKNTEDISSLSEEKLNKNQGISNSGKYLVVGADGNITFSDESTDSPEKPLGDYNYSLPDGYKKVDYIDSKGTLHYFLDWTPTVNSRMVQKVIPIEGVNTFIGFAADNNLTFGYQIITSSKKVATYLGNSFAISKSEKSFEPDYKQYITVDIANGSQKVEELEIGTKTSIFDVYESWNNKYPIVGGAFQTWYDSGSQIALTRHKLVRCQIYESEELVYDFVPALRETDSVCGLYDLVNSSFASGRTYNNYTQSYDYGEIIDDTGGQNGENAENTENTHIIVSEMTGDAIQDAINQCKSSGGGVIELLPGGVYICDSPLTIYTDRVDIIGNGAKLDFSGISSDIVCVTLQSSGDISDYSEMIREEYLHYVRGVYFVGPNRTANYEGGRIGTALMFTGTETKISTGYTVDNCVIAGFKTGVDLFTNSWCVKFSNCDISVCYTGIQMISGGQNYGEKFTFTSCTIHSCSVGAVCNHNAGTLQFLGCAMDYNFCAFKTDNQAHIIFTGGHIENNKDKNYFCICSNFGIVLIANSVLHGSQTQYGFASVSEAGKVIMSNCMKESWTMGEDEKDDNGNSKIIYDWINFAS